MYVTHGIGTVYQISAMKMLVVDLENIKEVRG
jgi:hypothetical protein